MSRQPPVPMSRSSPAPISQAPPASMSQASPAPMSRVSPAPISHAPPVPMSRALPALMSRVPPSLISRGPPAVMSRAPPTKCLGHRRQPQPVHVDLECQALAEDSYRARPRHHHTSPWRCFMTIPAHTAGLCAKREDTWAMNGSIISILKPGPRRLPKKK